MRLDAIGYAIKCDNLFGKALTVAETKQTTEQRQWSQRKAKRQAPPKDAPLNTPALLDEIVRLLKEGCTTREICDMAHMPSRATLFDWLQKDQDFRAKYEQAKIECAYAIIDDAADYVRTAVETDETPDHARVRAAEVYSKAAGNYAAAVAPRQLGQLVKLGADGEMGGLQVVITNYVQEIPARSAGNGSGQADRDGSPTQQGKPGTSGE